MDIPSALATPTDLSAQNTAEIAALVNPLIADSFALYVKTKNFHWHLSGPHFRDYHLLFDEQAESILEGIDPLAERMRKIGQTTIRSIGHIGSLSSIKDDNEPFVSANDMVAKLLADNKAMAVSQRKAIDFCEEKGDSPTSNLIQEILDQTERRIWFLFEISSTEKP